MNRQVHKYLCPKCQLLNSPSMDDFIKSPFVSFLIFMFQFAFKFLLGFFFFGFKISHSSGCNLTEKKKKYFTEPRARKYNRQISRRFLNNMSIKGYPLISEKKHRYIHTKIRDLIKPIPT